MLKEYIICIIIIISIFIGNNITQNYTINSIENMNNDLRELKDIVDRNSENDFNILNEKKEEIDKRWNEMFSKLAYYIEHDELEKFAKNLENIKTYIEEEEYGECKKEINEGIYILEHIEAKYSFDLQNIF